MKTKLFKGSALILLIALMALNVTIISTKNNKTSLSLKNTEAKACWDMEGITGYVALMENVWCYVGGFPTPQFEPGCADALSTCTL